MDKCEKVERIDTEGGKAGSINGEVEPLLDLQRTRRSIHQGAEKNTESRQVSSRD